MARYRKKPVEVEAWLWDETKETFSVLQAAGMKCGHYDSHTTENYVRNMRIETLEGSMRADKGDWVIKGVKGEFYPVKDEIFRMTYDAVAENLEPLGFLRKIDGLHSGSSDCATYERPSLTFEFKCFGCGRPLQIPIRPEWDNPVYVMEMERHHRLRRDEIADMHEALIELAGECVDAGVKPSILQRADDMKEKLKSMLKWFEDHQQ